jgi:hypothetical protein
MFNRASKCLCCAWPFNTATALLASGLQVDYSGYHFDLCAFVLKASLLHDSPSYFELRLVFFVDRETPWTI